jgi:protocatechuate 3,4-dioxygenase beta subunit
MHLPWIPSDLLQRISSSRTHDECSALLTELAPTVVGRLKVQLRGDTLHDQVLTDDQGYFRFQSLAPGTYELSAELPLTNPWTGGSALLRASSQVHLETGAEAVRIDLGLRESLVTIRGRVLDPLGAPIAGVTVEGRAVPIERHDLPNDGVESPFTVRAETDPNGEYVLPGFLPLSFFNAAWFLLGLCNEVGMEHVDVGVSDPRFEATNATRVILMTEALSLAAAPLSETLRALPASVKFPRRQPGADASKVKLYSSQSNDILGVDIVAEPRR